MCIRDSSSSFKKNKTYAYNGINFTENENISVVSYLVHEYEHNTSQSSVFRGNFTLRTPELTTLRNLPFTNSDFVSVSSNLYEFPLSLIAFDKSGNELLIEETFLICLLYTSDAADDMQCVDLGGRRIIKKKQNVSS